MVFNKNSMVEIIAEQTGCTKKLAKLAADQLIEQMSETLINGDNVELANFGKFETVIKNERNVNNVYTKEIIKIPAKRYLKFKASLNLKNAIKNKD